MSIDKMYIRGYNSDSQIAGFSTSALVTSETDHSLLWQRGVHLVELLAACLASF